MDAAPARRRVKPPKPAPILVPEEHTPYELSLDGTFREKDFEISRTGVRFGVHGMARSASGGDLAILGDADLWLPATAGHSRQSSACGDAGDPPPSPGAPGAFDVALRDLRITGVIGRGASGVVHSALHVPSGALYALKVIPLDVREAVRKRIIGELRCLHATLHCPAIVPLHAAFLSEGSVAIVLEHMDRGSLAELLAQHGPLPEAHSRVIAARVLLGLCFLHEQNIIHRDLKPSNLLLNGRGEVKISDFGVSGQLAHGRAESSSWLGTAGYMAPERIGGGTYGFSSDCWALGIVLVECTTGRFPYQATAEGAHLDFWELLECITEQAPPALPGQGSFSAPFRAFVGDCLQKDPAARWSASELARHPWLEARDDEVADGGPGGAAGEALLADLVHQLRPSTQQPVARRSVPKLPPLHE